MLGPLVFSLIVLQGGLTSAVTAEKTLFTFHTRKVTWNTANNVCKENGGRLAKMDTANIEAIVKHYKDTDWPSASRPWSNYFYWIGLHDSDIPNTVFSWSGRCENLESHTNWRTDGNNNEPDEPTNQHCVSKGLVTGHWYTQLCTNSYKFLCENLQGQCVFKNEQGKSLDSSQDLSSEIIPMATAEECKEQCRTLEQDDRECWAVTFTTGASGGVCTFFYATDQFIPSDSRLWIDQDDSTLYIRLCYEGVIDSDQIPNNLVEDNTEPLSACYQNDATPEGVTSTVVDEYSLSTMQPLPSVTQSPSLMADSQPSTSSLSWQTSAMEEPTPPLVQSMSTSLSLIQSISTSSAVVQPWSTSLALTQPMSTRTDSMSLNADELTPSTDIPLVASTPSVDVIDTDIVSQSEVSESTCWCPCPNKTILTVEESSAFISSILQDMDIVEEKTSSWKRQHISVYEDRPVALSLGYFGAIILAVVFGGLVLMDLPKLRDDISMLLDRAKGHHNEWQ